MVGKRDSWLKINQEIFGGVGETGFVVRINLGNKKCPRNLQILLLAKFTRVQLSPILQTLLQYFYNIFSRMQVRDRQKNTFLR